MTAGQRVVVRGQTDTWVDGNPATENREGVTLPDVAWRLTSSEQRLDRLESRTQDLNKTESEILGLRRDLEALRDDVASLRRAIITSAISFASGAVILAISILIATRP